MRYTLILISCYSTSLLAATASLASSFISSMDSGLLRRPAQKDSILLGHSKTLQKRSGNPRKAASAQTTRSRRQSTSTSDQDQSRQLPEQGSADSSNPLARPNQSRSQSPVRPENPGTLQISAMQGRPRSPPQSHMRIESPATAQPIPVLGRSRSPQQGSLPIEHSATAHVIPVQSQGRSASKNLLGTHSSNMGQNLDPQMPSAARTRSLVSSKPGGRMSSRSTSPSRDQGPAPARLQAIGNPARAAIEASGPSILESKRSSPLEGVYFVPSGQIGAISSSANPAWVSGVYLGRGPPDAMHQAPENHPMRVKAGGDMISGWVRPPLGGSGHVKISTPEGSSETRVEGGQTHNFAGGSHLPGGTQVTASTSGSAFGNSVGAISAEGISFPMPVPGLEGLDAQVRSSYRRVSPERGGQKPSTGDQKPK